MEEEEDVNKRKKEEVSDSGEGSWCIFSPKKPMSNWDRNFGSL